MYSALIYNPALVDGISMIKLVVLTLKWLDHGQKIKSEIFFNDAPHFTCFGRYFCILWSSGWLFKKSQLQKLIIIKQNELERQACKNDYLSMLTSCLAFLDLKFFKENCPWNFRIQFYFSPVWFHFWMVYWGALLINFSGIRTWRWHSTAYFVDCIKIWNSTCLWGYDLHCDAGCIREVAFESKDYWWEIDTWYLLLKSLYHILGGGWLLMITAVNRNTLVLLNVV